MQKSTLSIRPRAFFALTYLLSWAIWIPLALSHFGIGPFHIAEGASSIVRLLGVLMPATAALLLTAHAGGRQALRDLMGRLAIWRVGWQWWGAAVLVQPALLVLSGLVYNRVWGQPAVTVIPLLSFGALVVNIIFLALATLGEEIGWRGVALPALQQRSAVLGAAPSALAGSAILGLLWAAWHIPFWLLLDTFDQFGLLYLALNFLLVFPMTFYITWFFNHTKSSILLVAGSHLAFNIVNTALFPVTINIGAFGLFIAVEWLAAILVLPHLEPRPGSQQLFNPCPSVKSVSNFLQEIIPMQSAFWPTFQKLLPFLIPVLIIQLILLVAALADLIKQPALRGPKWVWTLIVIFVNILGPILYFVMARKED